MKKIIAIIIAICLFNVVAPMASFSQQKGHHPVQQKKHGLLSRIFKHKKRERELKLDAGHNEFKYKSKKDRKRLGRHHVIPSGYVGSKKYKYSRVDGNGNKGAGSKGSEDGKDKKKDKDKGSADKDSSADKDKSPDTDKTPDKDKTPDTEKSPDKDKTPAPDKAPDGDKGPAKDKVPEPDKTPAPAPGGDPQPPKDK